MSKDKLISKFFSDRLGPREQADFDRLMATDEAFREEVQLGKRLRKTLSAGERHLLKRQLQGYEQRIEKRKRRRWLAAASVLLLFSFFLAWYGNRTPDLQELYAEHFEPYRNVVAPIERGTEPTNLKTKAFADYEKQDYLRALEGFDALLARNEDPLIRFYKANTLLYLNRTEEAVALLRLNLDHIDSLKEKHRWYLAMAYLKLGDGTSAKGALEALLNETASDYKREEAEALLKQLN